MFKNLPRVISRAKGNQETGKSGKTTLLFPKPCHKNDSSVIIDLNYHDKIIVLNNNIIDEMVYEMNHI